VMHAEHLGRQVSFLCPFSKEMLRFKRQEVMV
jgi:hypothetical protein